MIGNVCCYAVVIELSLEDFLVDEVVFYDEDF